jgi:hypothetical protein
MVVESGLASGGGSGWWRPVSLRDWAVAEPGPPRDTTTRTAIQKYSRKEINLNVMGG